ncbi:hypothetical protein JCM9803A_03070 [Rhodococcus erythropolis]
MTVTVERQDRENLIAPNDLMRRILGYIEANLSDPQLDPSTVAHWIRSRRLDKCRHTLLVEPHTNITAVIARYGYFELAQFSRSFSAQYGVDPTQFRARYR